MRACVQGDEFSGSPGDSGGGNVMVWAPGVAERSRHRGGVPRGVSLRSALAPPYAHPGATGRFESSAGVAPV